MNDRNRGVTTAAAPVDTALVQGVLQQVARRVVGQEYMVERLLISLLTGGHVLLEGVPGLAKTLTVRTLAETIHTTFHRIQFTPDDVKAIAPVVLRHRVLTTYEAEAEEVTSDDIVQKILATVEAP